MRGIVTRLMEFDGADGASLSTIDDEFAYFKVCEGADVQLQDQTLPLVATLGNECVLRGDIAVLRATTGPEVARCLTPGAGSIILAPIDYDGAIRGILGVRSTDVAAFDDNDVRRSASSPVLRRSRCGTPSSSRSFARARRASAAPFTPRHSEWR